MTFDEVLEQALEMLQRCGRVLYRLLKIPPQLSNELHDRLIDDIFAVHRLTQNQNSIDISPGHTLLVLQPVRHPTPPQATCLMQMANLPIVTSHAMRLVAQFGPKKLRGNKKGPSNG